MFELTGTWKTLLESEFEKDYYKNLMTFLEGEYSTKAIYPPKELVFNALNLTDYKDVKVLILGQDPYHQKGQGCGLSFSVNKGVKIPPSLVNIYKELNSDLGIAPVSHGDLTAWAKQGVLLLNTALTVQDSNANSHRGQGWEQFTDRIITLLNLRDDPIVFILWGKNARDKTRLITSKRHLIIESAHPSPFSARSGFFGSKPFSRTNHFLQEFTEPIDWAIPE